MSKKRGLGRGLGALIPATDNPNEGLRIVPVESIEPNPHQPRSYMDKEALAELTASIKEHGLIQPLIVTEVGPGRYTLIAGERRWRASQAAKLGQVPVVVKEATPQEMLELAIIENIQRADLNALEEALAYQQLIDEFGLTQERVSTRVGKARSTVANLVRLLDLPPDVQQAVVDGKLSGTHARHLLPLPTSEMQVQTMHTILKKRLTVRETAVLVTKLLATKKPRPKRRVALSPELADVERQIRERLNTQVDLQMGAKGGKLVIHFQNDEDLNAIYDTIIGDDD